MKTRKVWMVTPVSAALCAVMVCFLIPMFFLNRTLFYIQAVLSLCMIGITIWHAVTLHRSIRRYLGSLISNLNPEDRMALENMPIPVTAVTAEGELLWYNTLFRREVLGGEDVYGSKLETVFNGLTAERLNRRLFPQVRSKGNTYVIYAAKLRKGGQGAYVLYCIDNTELTRIAKEYEDSRPVVLSLYIDNSEEITQNLRDSERAQLISRVETLLEDWIGACAGIFRKCGSDRFLALVEHRHLAGMLESRFDILDKVRSVRTAEGVSVTLSIGVGIGKSFFGTYCLRAVYLPRFLHIAYIHSVTVPGEHCSQASLPHIAAGNGKLDHLIHIIPPVLNFSSHSIPLPEETCFL